MPFRIQRVPQGLNNLLSIFGGGTPVDLEDRVRGTVEMLQFYALQQRQTMFTNNAALAEGGSVDVLTNQPAGTANKWGVLFSAAVTVVKTGTATALRASIRLQRSGSQNTTPVATGELGPFGATETGSTHVIFLPPYPLILVPPWTVLGTLDILGTDATASVTINADVGLLQ